MNTEHQFEKKIGYLKEGSLFFYDLITTIKHHQNL